MLLLVLPLGLRAPSVRPLALLRLVDQPGRQRHLPPVLWLALPFLLSLLVRLLPVNVALPLPPLLEPPLP